MLQNRMDLSGIWVLQDAVLNTLHVTEVPVL